MDVAPWCYKWMDGWDWISPGGVRYRASYSSYEFYKYVAPVQNLKTDINE